MNSGRVLLTVFAHAGLVSGSSVARHVNASKIEGGNVVWSAPRRPVPLANRAALIDCLGRPIGFSESLPSKAGSWSRRCVPLGTSE